MDTNIDPRAIVSKDAIIGEGTQIGPYAIIDANVKIGSNCIIKPFAHVCEYTEMGEGCRVMEHAVIGGIPQDLSFKGEVSYVKLANRVTCREYVTVNRSTGEGNSTMVGDDTLLMEGVHVAHNAVIGKNCTVANKTGISGHVKIDDFCVIGGMSGFHQFVHIGSYCMIGGMSRVSQDVPPYLLASGAPLYVYDINKVGLIRRSFDEAKRRLIRRIYKLVYDSGLKLQEAVEEIKNNYGGTQEAHMVLDFIAGATRGIAPRITSLHKRADRGR